MWTSGRGVFVQPVKGPGFSIQHHQRKQGKPSAPIFNNGNNARAVLSPELQVQVLQSPGHRRAALCRKWLCHSPAERQPAAYSPYCWAHSRNAETAQASTAPSGRTLSPTNILCAQPFFSILSCMQARTQDPGVRSCHLRQNPERSYTSPLVMPSALDSDVNASDQSGACHLPQGGPSLFLRLLHLSPLLSFGVWAFCCCCHPSPQCWGCPGATPGRALPLSQTCDPKLVLCTFFFFQHWVSCIPS